MLNPIVLKLGAAIASWTHTDIVAVVAVMVAPVLHAAAWVLGWSGVTRRALFQAKGEEILWSDTKYR